MEGFLRAMGRRMVLVLILTSLGGVGRLISFGSHGNNSSGTSQALAQDAGGSETANPWGKGYVAPQPGAVPTAAPRAYYSYASDYERERRYERVRERERLEDYYREEDYRRQMRAEAAARRAASQPDM